MNIGEAVLSLYPDAMPPDDYRIVDRLDGQGPQLVYWNEAKLGPQPTAEEFAAAGPPVPQEITILQARRALRHAGLLSQVETLVGTQTDPDAYDAFHYATTWHRDAPWIANLAPALNLTAAQIDDLFRLAATL